LLADIRAKLDRLNARRPSPTRAAADRLIAEIHALSQRVNALQGQMMQPVLEDFEENRGGRGFGTQAGRRLKKGRA
jgi:hypothetical protein